MKKKLVSMMLVSAMAVTAFAACGDSAKQGGDSQKPADSAATGDSATSESEHKNEISGDASAADAFVVWGWNDDIKKLLDGPFAADNADDHKRIVFVNTGGADYYQTQIDALLQTPDNEMYPDLMGLEIDYVQKYVPADGALATMADLGITDEDLADQYDFNRAVCSSDGSGKAEAMKASFWQCTPGAWVLRADLCEKYLGTTDPVKLQEMFATWEKVEETAAKINDASKGKCKILSGWDDLNRVFMNNRKSGWYDSNDKIVVDDQVKAYLEEAKKFYDNNWTFNTTQWQADWDAMKAGDGVKSEAALAYTGCPWFQYWCLPADSWKGQTITIAGPQSFYWGGTGLAATASCADKELAGRIIKWFTTDEKSMQKIAEFNCDFVNNKKANDALLAESETFVTDKENGYKLASGNGLMHSQNYMQVYIDILKNTNIDTSIVKSEDKTINDTLNDYVKKYFENGDLDATLSDLKAYIHDTFTYLSAE